MEIILGEVSKEEIDLHYLYSTGYYKNLKLDNKVLDWYRRLIDANNRKGKLSCFFIASDFLPSWQEVKCNHKSTSSQDGTKLRKADRRVGFLFWKGGEAEGCSFRTAAAGREPWTKERR